MTASVTAIVLNWCAEHDTVACIESLERSSYDALSVLLVDNASPDGSGERLHARFPDIAYLQTASNLGYAGGNNRGIDRALAAGAEYVLIVNDDTVLDPECVATLVRAAEDTGAAAVAPQILYFDDPATVWYGGGVFSPTRALGLHIRENLPSDPSQTRSLVTFVCGCCFLIRGSVLRELGGFDESYFAYVEDLELSLRLSRRGYRMLYEPKARVLHRIKRGAESTPFQIRQRDRNRRRLVSQYYGVFRRIRFAVWFYPTRLIHLVKYVGRRDWASAQAILDGALGRIEQTSPTP